MKTARPGFSILELLVAMAVFSAILAIVFSVLDHSIRVWRQANSKIDAFQSARAAFEIVTNRLSHATLNPYWDYYDAAGNPFRNSTNPATFAPAKYGRYSDLHFVSGQAVDLIPQLSANYSAIATQAVFFATPTGITASPNYESMPDLLTASGFFVAFGNDEGERPKIIDSPLMYRWRLMELSSPTESLAVFGSGSGPVWFTGPVGNGEVRPIAENVIALIVWPRLSPENDPTGATIAPTYAYDSRTTASWTGTPPKQPVQASQLPPSVQVTMVVIDEASAARIANGATPPPQIDTATQGLFTASVEDYGANLDKLEQQLAKDHLTYRTFTTTIAIQEARWSP